MLSQLPLELLRRICTELSPEAALHFAHSCRQTYHSCDDWIVWRSIVKSVRVRTEPPAAVLERGCKGIEHTMANAGTVQPGAGHPSITAIEQYMPQLIVLGYTMATPLDLRTMYDQCRALVSRQEYPSSLIRAKTDESKWFEFMTDPTSRFAPREWLSAQTASLCFAIGALSDVNHAYQSEEPYARLEDVQWFNSNATQQDCADTLVMQHALANTAVGCFSLELRAALGGERTIGEDFEGTASPPTASSIPLAAQMVSSLLSSPGNFKDSSPSCLMATVDPVFFTSHAWTGYLTTRGDWRSVYHGIGGHNLRDLPLTNGLDHAGSASFPIALDHTVRFRVVDTLANGDFVLQSNYFHTRDDMYTMTVLVEKRTGRLSICMLRPDDAPPRAIQAYPRNALNTPFGIVYGIEPGSWLWLWKTEWSVGSSRGR
ncbi:uncharacterized protein M421DRAFT_267072 [Didymella exigua CBS 183.55]|uniref:F-box domain-containing protein n=1 Tax=Didymella exigua CBS 183.55 TaxID=1150837 RepID=A0A6A5RCJ5_9PLEO|nr:uncharacterized protein M421DRAFT_267072 [Didymella exigua CBS 183.55]KAF1925010.1 hypothetical protein M421DRAFT_267072 [Didymella exigua CBS 183.55]